jgi:hypothetical protein
VLRGRVPGQIRKKAFNLSTVRVIVKKLPLTIRLGSEK